MAPPRIAGQGDQTTAWQIVIKHVREHHLQLVKIAIEISHVQTSDYDFLSSHN